eukprot:6418-Heterococcus_DN1.PRE.2
MSTQCMTTPHSLYSYCSIAASPSTTTVANHTVLALAHAAAYESAYDLAYHALHARCSVRVLLSSSCKRVCTRRATRSANSHRLHCCCKKRAASVRLTVLFSSALNAVYAFNTHTSFHHREVITARYSVALCLIIAVATCLRCLLAAAARATFLANRRLPLHCQHATIDAVHCATDKLVVLDTDHILNSVVLCRNCRSAMLLLQR